MSKRKHRGRSRKRKSKKRKNRDNKRKKQFEDQPQDSDLENENQPKKKKSKQSKAKNKALLEDFKRRQRRQDIAFIIFIFILATILITGYYFYFFYGASEENEGINDIANDLNGKNSSEQNFNGDDGIDWYGYEEGVQIAKNNNKHVLIDFYTDWCIYCKDMDENTYSDQRVIEKAKEFVCVKVDGDARQDLVARYGITGYPTTVFLDHLENEINRVSGYVPPEYFLEDMDSVLNNY